MLSDFSSEDSESNLARMLVRLLMELKNNGEKEEEIPFGGGKRKFSDLIR